MAGKDHDIKVRVPAVIKKAFKAYADSRFTTESEIAREALLEYAERHGIPLRDSSEAPSAPPTPPPAEPVTYRGSKSSKRSEPSEATAKAVVAIVKKHYPQPKGHQ